MGCNCSAASSDVDKEESNRTFCVSKVHSNGTERCMRIQVTESDLILYQKGKDPIYWPLRCLRNYGFSTKLFCFESGRRCSTGPGLYTFKCKQAEDLFNTVQASVQQASGLEEDHPWVSCIKSYTNGGGGSHSHSAITRQVKRPISRFVAFTGEESPEMRDPLVKSTRPGSSRRSSHPRRCLSSIEKSPDMYEALVKSSRRGRNTRKLRREYSSCPAHRLSLGHDRTVNTDKSCPYINNCVSNTRGRMSPASPGSVAALDSDESTHCISSSTVRDSQKQHENRPRVFCIRRTPGCEKSLARHSHPTASRLSHFYETLCLPLDRHLHLQDQGAGGGEPAYVILSDDNGPGTSSPNYMNVKTNTSSPSNTSMKASNSFPDNISLKMSTRSPTNASVMANTSSPDYINVNELSPSPSPRIRSGIDMEASSGSPSTKTVGRRSSSRRGRGRRGSLHSSNRSTFSTPNYVNLMRQDSSSSRNSDPHRSSFSNSPQHSQLTPPPQTVHYIQLDLNHVPSSDHSLSSLTASPATTTTSTMLASAELFPSGYALIDFDKTKALCHSAATRVAGTDGEKDEPGARKTRHSSPVISMAGDWQGREEE